MCRRFKSGPDHFVLLEFPGAVAQLGERFHGMEEVVSSTLIGSTSRPAVRRLTTGRTALRGDGGFRRRFV